jgi:hypothetical protein
LEKEGDPVTWHGTGLWTIGLLVAALALWVLLRGRLRARQYHRIAEELGFTYQGRRLPETLDLSKASFGEPWDIATNVIAGTLKGIETIAWLQTDDCGHEIKCPGSGTIKPLAKFRHLCGKSRGVDRHVQVKRGDCALPDPTFSGRLQELASVFRGSSSSAIGAAVGLTINGRTVVPPHKAM